jgi:hypothetical protein
VLDRNIVKMVVSNIRGRLNLDQAPALISTALKYIDSDENVSMLERPFEDRWNLWILD